MRKTGAIKATKRPTKKYGQIVTKRSAAWDTDVQGVGKYHKNAGKPLTRRQAYKLEKRALANERLKINSKPEMIKQAGLAISQNLSPALSSYGASSGFSKILNAKNSVHNHTEIPNLIEGGVNKAGLNNAEEEEEAKESTDFLPR